MDEEEDNGTAQPVIVTFVFVPYSLSIWVSKITKRLTNRMLKIPSYQFYSADQRLMKLASFMDNGTPSPENFPGYGKEVKKRKSFRANCQNHHNKNNNNYGIVSYPLTAFLFVGIPQTKETEAWKWNMRTHTPDKKKNSGRKKEKLQRVIPY